MNYRKVENPIFHIFIILAYITLNTKDNLGKFDSKRHGGILLGYSETSKAYGVYNSRTCVVEEAIHVKFNDYKLESNYQS